jgi:hypothetical protein
LLIIVLCEQNIILLIIIHACKIEVGLITIIVN